MFIVERLKEEWTSYKSNNLSIQILGDKVKLICTTRVHRFLHAGGRPEGIVLNVGFNPNTSVFMEYPLRRAQRGGWRGGSAVQYPTFTKVIFTYKTSAPTLLLKMRTFFFLETSFSKIVFNVSSLVDGDVRMNFCGV